jgi:hypothetical protein
MHYVDVLMWVVLLIIVFIGLCAAVSTAIDVWKRKPRTIEDNSNLIEPDYSYASLLHESQLTLEQLMDKSSRNRAEAKRIECAVCKLMGIDPNGNTEAMSRDDAKTYQMIVAAVYEGRNWPRLFAAHNFKTFDSRWDSRTRSRFGGVR